MRCLVHAQQNVPSEYATVKTSFIPGVQPAAFAKHTVELDINNKFDRDVIRLCYTGQFIWPWGVAFGAAGRTIASEGIGGERVLGAKGMRLFLYVGAGAGRL